MAKKQTEHPIPQNLLKRIEREKAAAEEQINRINTIYGQTVQNLLAGYAASLDPDKTYTIGPDGTTLIENGGSKENTGAD